jgi:HEAT repeat protein
VTSRLSYALLLLLLVAASAAAQSNAASDLNALIGRLGSLEYPVRNGAARQIRRAPTNDAVAALTAAARTHRDEFVRYRAFVLLTSFSDRASDDLARELLRDRNDRVRQVAYEWLERHPDPRLTDTLLGLLQSEQAEFVRPALIGAVAALDEAPVVQRTLIAETSRGLDFFRVAVIDALGRHRATYAVDAIISVTRLDGPLQDDAVLALGRIGDTRALPALSAIANPPVDVALTIRAARCLLGEDCDAQVNALSEAAQAPRATQGAVRAAANALAAMGAAGRESATAALVALAARGGGVRDEAAVAFAGVAVRRPDYVLAWLETSPPDVRRNALALLKDGFDALEEDFGEEQFFAAARATYWKGAENSPTRTLMASIIDTLEF